MKDIRKFLKENIVLLDGAMGTMLLESGTDLKDGAEVLNITDSKLIKKIHGEYVKSGADIIYANTFGANSLKIPHGYKLFDIISAAINNAKEAANGQALVAYDMGPSGQLLEPSGKYLFDDAYNLFKEQAVLAQSCGADLIVCETFTDLYEMKAALLAVKENSCLPVICSMSFEDNGRTVHGTDVSSMALTLEGLGADCIGINCSAGPAQLLPLVKELIKYTELPIIVKANAGIPLSDGSYSVLADEFADVYLKLLECGVSVIGGCCGTTPAYIEKLKTVSKNLKPLSRNAINFTAVCSSVKTVIIDGVKVVGERLNPTGKKPYREALLKGDYDFVLAEGLKQKEAGADILDVNAGLPDIDEAEIITKAVKTLQGAIDLPLQIDSGNADAIEKALRYYNGKAIVNSVTGDDHILNSVLPVVKKYGACVIGLTLDKNGLPENTQKRIEIADKIINCAVKHGIKKSDVIIDPLALTVSTEQPQVEYTLEALKILKSRGVKTLLGVSNISFGLPNRDYINLSFLISALNSGLNLPIINPCSEIMINAVNAYRVLSGEDKFAANYINISGNSSAPSEKKDNVKSDNRLIDSIVKGLKQECSLAAKELLEKFEPMDIVNSYVIPALDKVGDLYDRGKIFLPQLINSADAVKYAFEEIKKKLPKDNALTGKKIVMATVLGDIHDIGKNIVSAVLENYGYEIIDLGKNVDPSEIINAIVLHKAPLVGLSALMTTTVRNMELTIKLIKEAKLKCKIMVGGAVLTADYAEKIGSDYYAKDANAASKIAKEVFG